MENNQYDWASAMLGSAYGGIGMLSYLINKINKNKEFKSQDMNIRDRYACMFISMRPYIMSMPENEVKEQIDAYYRVVDKFLIRTDAYKKPFESFVNSYNQQSSVPINDDIKTEISNSTLELMNSSDLSLIDETVITLMVCTADSLVQFLDENQDRIGDCYKFAEMFVGQMESYKKHQQRIKKLEDKYNNEYNKQHTPEEQAKHAEWLKKQSESTKRLNEIMQTGQSEQGSARQSKETGKENQSEEQKKDSTK